MSEKIANYFFSGWIENLGVVPLFLSAFFLTAPAFFFLSARRLSVTFVLDAMSKLLKTLIYQISYYFKSSLWDTFVPIYGPLVKKIMRTLPLFFVFFTIFSFLTHQAFSTLAPASPRSQLAPSQTLILSVGEHSELSLPELTSYSIGNQEIIKHKWMGKERKLLLQAKKIGSTEILIMEGVQGSKQKTKKIALYIFSKNHHLKVTQTKALLKAIGLTPQFDGSLLTVSGEVNSMNHLKIVQDMVKKKSKEEELFYLNIHPSDSLKKNILATIYTLLLKESVEDLNCEFEQLQIQCSYDETTPPSKEARELLKEKFATTLHPLPSKRSFQNYLIQFELFQVEKASGEEFSLGLSELNFNIKDFFQEDWANNLNIRNGHLRDQNLIFKTLAHPKLTATINKKVTLNIGSDIPIKAQKEESESILIDWKFAGLKLSFNLKQHFNKLILIHNVEISQAKDSSINGTKESSSMIMEENDAKEIFSASIQTNSFQEDKLPLFADFPFIGQLFSDHSKGYSHKKIFLLVQIRPLGVQTDEANNRSDDEWAKSGTK